MNFFVTLNTLKVKLVKLPFRPIPRSQGLPALKRTQTLSRLDVYRSRTNLKECSDQLDAGLVIKMNTSAFLQQLQENQSSCGGCVFAQIHFKGYWLTILTEYNELKVVLDLTCTTSNLAQW